MVATSTRHVRTRRDAATQRRIARHLVTRSPDADGSVRVEKTRTGYRVTATVTGSHEGRRFRQTTRGAAPTVGQALRAVARGLGVHSCARHPEVKSHDGQHAARGEGR